MKNIYKILSITLFLSMISVMSMGQDAPVIWTDLVGVTVDGANTLKKTAPDGTNNGGAASQQIIPAGVDGSVSFTTHGSANLYFGISSTNYNASKNKIHYAFVLRNNNNLQIRENDTWRVTVSGGYSSNTALKIQREGNTVKYYRDNQEVYASTVPATDQLLLDVTILDSNHEIRNAMINTGGDGGTSPDAPSNLVVSESGDDLTLSWTDNASDETHYDVERSVSDDANFTALATVAGTTTNYIDATVNSGVVYYYRVKARNASGSSTFSNTSSGSVSNTPPPSSDGAITWSELVGISVGSNNSLIKTASNGASNSGAVSTEVLAAGASGSASFTTHGAVALYFGLSANNDGNSTSSIDYAFFLKSNNKLQIRENGVFIKTVGTYVADQELKIERTGSVIEYQQAGNVVHTSTVASTSSLIVDVSIVDNGDEIRGASVSFGTSTPAIPQAPTALTSIGGNNQVNLSWVDNSDNETGFEIERSLTSGGGFTALTTTNANITTFDDTGLASGQTYYYRVRAMGASGSSDFSNVASATVTGTPPPPPPTSEGAITWTDLVGLSVGSANELIKTAINGNNNGGAASEEVLPAGVDGWVSFKTHGTVNLYFGLSATNVNANKNTVNYAFVLRNNNALQIRENDVYRTKRNDGYAPGMELKIERVGTTVKYYVDDTEVYTSQIASTQELLVDLSILDQNHEIRDARVSFGSAPAIPQSPTSLVSTGSTNSEISLSWTDNSDNESGFEIERSTNSTSGFSSVGTVGANVTSFVNGGLPENSTYYYRVRAVNGSEASAYSNVINVTTGVSIPSSPTGLAVSASTTSSITISWSDNASNELNYEIHRSANSGAGFSLLATVNANTTSYTNTGLTEGTSFYYRVRAVNAGGNSAFSNQVNGTTGISLPIAPTDLQVTSVDAGAIHLLWTDNATNETSYELERSGGSGDSFTRLILLGENITAYINNGLNEGTSYSYRIRAISDAGVSEYSNIVTSTTGVTLPSAPTGLTVTSTSVSAIALSWNDNANNELNYQIYRSNSSGSGFVLLTTVNANMTGFTNTSLPEGSQYYYKVRARNAAGVSAFSNEVSGTTSISLPQAPTGLTANASVNSVQLNWVDNAINEQEYELERSITSSSSGFSRIATLPVNAETYDNVGLTAGSTYHYRVRAKNAAGYSAYSNVRSVTTQEQLTAAPSDLQIIPSVNSVRLTWKDNADNEDGFELVRSSSSNGTYSTVTFNEANNTSYVNGGLSATTTYYYKVRALKGALASAYSPVVAVTTLSTLTINTDLSQKPQYNGNISAIQWKSFNGDEEQLYTYHYDAMNRIKAAHYGERSSATSWTQKAGGFQVYGIEYDLNGNIEQLNRQEWNQQAAEVIDKLSYSYAGNRLQSVEDQAGWEGFSNGHAGTAGDEDYDYDANGNLTLDKNKNITDIEYNYLNLPEKVTKSDGAYITYGYDAAGIKLYQEVYNATNQLVKRTDYFGEFIYETDGPGATSELKLIHHEEGRIVLDESTDEFEYQYYLRDHLGNNRVVVTSAPKELEFVATMESENAAEEEALFMNVSENRVPFNAADANSDGGNEVVRLNGNNLMGPGISLPVGKGDKLDLEVYGYYEGGSGYSNQPLASTFISAVAGGFGGYSVGTELQQSTYSSLGGALGVIGMSGSADNNVPAAYLNYILFDENMQYYNHSGHIQISDAANMNHELMQIQDITVEKPGYVYIYLSNESTSLNWVYFDDLKVTLTEHAVVQEDDFYPFGMTHNGGFQRISKQRNEFMYNGKELIEDLELDWYSYGARNYDASLGRFFNQDRYAEKYYNFSPYQYAANNPALYIDVNGDSISTARTKGKNFFVTASKKLRKKDIQDHMPTKGPFKKLRAAFSSAYFVDNLKARTKQILSLGKLKVIAADNASDAVSQIKDKLGSDGFVKNLTIDFHVGTFGEDPFSGSKTETALRELAGGFAGSETSCYLGQCWAGGNSAKGLSDITSQTSEWLDGAWVYGNQSAASSISFALRSNFEGVIPTSYSKDPDNLAAIGKHTMSSHSGSKTIKNIIKIKNSGRIRVKRKISKRWR